MDGGDPIYFPWTGEEVLKRMGAFGLDPLELVDYNTGRDMVLQKYYELNASDFAKIAKEYDAWGIIVEKPKSLPFSRMYENNRFKIYKIE